MGLFDVLKDLFGVDVRKRTPTRKRKTAKKAKRKTSKKTKKKAKKKTAKKGIKKKPKKKPQKSRKKKTPKKTPKKKKTSPKKASKRKIKKSIPKYQKRPQEKEIGIITHYFGKISVGIIKLKGELKVGERIHVKGLHDDFSQTIGSMQLNHKDISVARKGDEIGIKVSQRVHPNDKVYKAA